MDKVRRLFIVTGMAGVASGLSGCFTAMLLEEKKGRYNEEISSVLLSRDSKKLVVVGDSYHYIFDAPDIIALTLVSPFRKAVSAEFHGFTLDGSETIEGDCVLKVQEALSSREKQEVLAAGYQPRPDGVYVYRARLKGKRYLAGEKKLVTEAYKLNRAYRVSISTVESDAERAGKLLLTPVTVAMDGTLFIAAVPLIALVFIAGDGKLDLR